MPEANFAYDTVADMGGLPLTLSIFADRPHLRELMCEDARAAGFRLTQASEIASLLEGEARPLGDVVLLDCPAVDGRTLAALARLDLHAAHAGAQLVVSTSVGALDDVFACMDQSSPQLLVDPTRAERIVALGGVLARVPRQRLRELGEEDRLALLRLTEQVARIAERLDRLTAAGGPLGLGGAARLETKPAFADAGPSGGEPLARQPRPAFPDPRLLRRIIRQRQLRARFFDGELFADPAWDMLLDLAAARAEHKRVSVTSLCIASGVPPTTALRWIGQLTEAGLLQRIEDETDRRRAFIALTDHAADAIARYFAELGSSAAQLV